MPGGKGSPQVEKTVRRQRGDVTDLLFDRYRQVFLLRRKDGRSVAVGLDLVGDGKEPKLREFPNVFGASAREYPNRNVLFERVTVKFPLCRKNRKMIEAVNIAEVVQSARTVVDRQKVSVPPVKERLKADEAVAKDETSARSETQESAPAHQVQPVEPVQPAAGVTANAGGLGQIVDIVV